MENPKVLQECNHYRNKINNDKFCQLKIHKAPGIHNLALQTLHEITDLIAPYLVLIIIIIIICLKQVLALTILKQQL